MILRNLHWTTVIFLTINDFDPVITKNLDSNPGVTIESLVEQLSINPNLIQIWDEINTLFESFGLYKAEKGAFEKSILNSLCNGTDNYSHDTKKNIVSIESPRLSVFGAVHPPILISLLANEQKMVSEGLISRYLICNSVPIDMDLS